MLKICCGEVCLQGGGLYWPGLYSEYFPISVGDYANDMSNEQFYEYPESA